MSNRTPQRNGNSNGNNQVVALLEKMKPQLERALPKHMDADRVARIALTELRKNPKLMQCNQNSLLGAIMQAAQLGLEPGLMGQCYLIPFKGEVTFVIGYKGLIDLARRSGDVQVIYAHPVYENDEFEYSYGVNGTLHHKPAMKERGEIICYYSFAQLKDGGYAYEVMTVEDVEKHRDRFALAKDKSGKIVGPWRDDFDSMACKTAVRQMMKYMPMSAEFLDKVARDETVTPGPGDDPMEIDYETGEVLDGSQNPEPEPQPRGAKDKIAGAVGADEPETKQDAEPPMTEDQYNKIKQLANRFSNERRKEITKEIAKVVNSKEAGAMIAALEDELEEKQNP